MGEEMKTIGVMSRIDTHNNKEILYIPLDIYKKINNGFNVIIIPFEINDTFKKIMNIIKNCDGIILPGGDDIYPVELEIVKYLHERNIPTLGICLGMQTMAVAFNSSFITNKLTNHKTDNRYAHKVLIDKNSLLYQIIGKNEIEVNSRHKDTITNPNLLIGAYSQDNVIEEVEDSSKRFFLGVQWHPENLNDDNSDKLFNYFFNSL